METNWNKCRSFKISLYLTLPLLLFYSIPFVIFNKHFIYKVYNKCNIFPFYLQCSFIFVNLFLFSRYFCLWFHYVAPFVPFNLFVLIILFFTITIFFSIWNFFVVLFHFDRPVCCIFLLILFLITTSVYISLILSQFLSYFFYKLIVCFIIFLSLRYCFY